jgi:hypothetical protein
MRVLKMLFCQEERICLIRERVKVVPQKTVIRKKIQKRVQRRNEKSQQLCRLFLSKIFSYAIRKGSSLKKALKKLNSAAFYIANKLQVYYNT